MLRLCGHNDFRALSIRVLKSDRINALKKQYDAFLEEDKVRKERNQYILGKLDKMRYPTSLVPVLHKPMPVMDWRSPVYNLPRHPLPVAVPCDLQRSTIVRSQIIPDTAAHNIDDSYLIQQISKKYILIPKLSTSLTRQATPVPSPDVLCHRDLQEIQEIKTINPNSNKPSGESNDWKSKYEILNILKKEENEKQKVQLTANPEINVKSENILNNITEKEAGDCESEITVETPNPDLGYKYLNDVNNYEVPEKLEKDQFEQSNDVKISDEIKNSPKLDCSLPPQTNTVEVADVDYGLESRDIETLYPVPNDNIVSPGIAPDYPQHEEGNYEESIVHQVFPEQGNYEEHFEPVYNEASPLPQNFDQVEDIAQYHDGNMEVTHDNPEVQAELLETLMQEAHIDDPNSNIAQTINSEELLQEIGTSLPDSKSADYVQYPTENITVQQQDIQDVKNPQESLEMQNAENPLKGVDIVDTNTTQEPQMPAVNHSVEEPVDSTDINAFDTEQREMFYSEQPAENYAYQGQDEVSEYNPEYDQNQTYQQNVEYSYYDPHQPQEYPMAEEEEEAQRYDQTYEQQYVEQQPRQYEQYEETPPAGYEQPDQLYQQQSYEAGEQLEATLNAGDGFTEQKQVEEHDESPNLAPVQ